MSTAPVVKKPIIIVQGGQWGSEAKGLITAKLVKDRRVDLCVRTGTVNAGHTVYYDGQPYKMQQLPVGWVRPETILVLGPGAYIHPEILQRELEWIEAAMPGTNVRERIIIDFRCGLHLPDHTERATIADRHHKMGATGKGCSEAVIDKIRGRGDSEPHTYRAFCERWGFTPAGVFMDTSSLLNREFDRGKTILIEGTQGTFLDLHLGPYPYTTHKQTQAANWMAEAGLSCTLPVELVSVMRTYPIRVAGNSGPMAEEISWVKLARRINERLARAGRPPLVADTAITAWENATIKALRYHEIPAFFGDPAKWSAETRKQYAFAASEIHVAAWECLDEPTQTELSKLFERTTVTNKLRRIAQWNAGEAHTSVRLNRPTSIALTFLNYVFPEAWGTTRATFGALPLNTRIAIATYVNHIVQQLGCPISYVGFGPQEEHTFCFYHDEIEHYLVEPEAVEEEVGG